MTRNTETGPALAASFAREHGIELPPGALEKLELFTAELAARNAAAGLVSPESLKQAWEAHVADSLSALILLDPWAAGRPISLLDIGSGAGLPGLVLAVARPNWRVVSAESSGKKHLFQKHVRRRLDLSNFEPLQTRLDPKKPGELTRAFDIAAARALADLPGFLALAAPFLRPGGAALALRGPAGLEEAGASLAAAEILGFEPPQRRSFELPASRAGRVLLLYRLGG